MRSYEELAEDLVRRLGAAHGITTLRLERDVLLSGRATANRIDVLWEFQQASGQRMRLAFECRSYSGSTSKRSTAGEAWWTTYPNLESRPSA